MNVNRETVQTASPFLNDYKRNFVLKRLLQTLLGGLILKFNSDIHVPWFIYFLQILLFTIPFLIGGVCILIRDLINSTSSNLNIPIIGACVYFFYLVCLKFVAIILTNKSYIKKNRPQKDSKSIKKKTRSNLLNDEQNYSFEKFFSYTTLEFILPFQNGIFVSFTAESRTKIEKRKLFICLLKILVDSSVAGFIMFCSIYFESINYLQTFYSLGASIVLFILHWILLSICFYSLTVRQPPEPAIYQPDDYLNIQHYTRAGYVLAFQIIECVYNFSSNNAQIPFLAIFYLKIFFTCLPLAWFLGLLPPLDGIILWFLEQCYIYLYGGTATATNLRLIFQLLLAIIVSLAHFIPNDIAIVVLFSSLGYLLSSIDMIFLIEWIKSKSLSSKVAPIDKNAPKSTKNKKEYPLDWKEWVYHLILFLLNTTVAVVIFTVFNANFTSTTTPLEIEQILLYICVGIFVLCKVFGDLQAVYIFFGLIRNPFYPKNSLSINLMTSKKSNDSPVSINQNKIFFKLLKYVRLFLIRFVAPLLLCAVISIDCHMNKIYGDKTFSYWRTLCVLRAYRWIWQSSYLCLFEMSATHIILFSITYNSNTDSSVRSGLIQYFLTGCLVASFLRDRLEQFTNKLYSFFLITITSWTVKKQRRRLAVLFIVLNFFLFIPICILVIIPASLLSAPLLPLFTFPLFFIGFPRTKKFWPQKENFFSNSINFLTKNSIENQPKLIQKKTFTSTDSSFYAQLIPDLLKSLKELIKSASLGQSIRADTFFLSRFQDRIIWIQIMETGHTYYIVNIKGLELQETSCHTQEAQYIDDTLELDFENPYGANANSDSKTKFLKFNSRPFNCLRSRDVLVFNAYSDAKNSLVGILDYPENLDLLFTIYPKVLHYFLFLFLINSQNISQPELKHHNIFKDEISKNTKSSRLSEYDLEMDPITRTELNTSFELKPPKDLDKLNQSALTKQNIILSPKKNSKKKEEESSFDEWSDDESDFGSAVNLKNKKSKSIPSKKSKNDNIDSIDFDINEILGFAPKHTPKPSKDRVEIKKDDFSTEFELKLQKASMASRQLASPKPSFASNSVQSILSIPNQWQEFLSENLNSSQSFNNEILKKSIMSKNWLSRFFELNKSTHVQNRDKLLVEYETDLWTSHYKFLLKCCQTIGLNEKSISLNFSPEAIHNLYRGELPWSPTNDKLVKQFPDLHKLLVKAFRNSIKMIIDHATISPISDDGEFFDLLESYEQEWFIGSEKEPEYAQNICNNKPYLFSLHRDASKKTLNSRTLSLQQIKSPLAQLNTEIVKSIWSSTNLELLYMTNDDEERYSIQAHPYILRNLTIQSSDPPLGYSVYNSENIYLSIANPF